MPGYSSEAKPRILSGTTLESAGGAVVKRLFLGHRLPIVLPIVRPFTCLFRFRCPLPQRIRARLVFALQGLDARARMRVRVYASVRASGARVRVREICVYLGATCLGWLHGPCLKRTSSSRSIAVSATRRREATRPLVTVAAASAAGASAAASPPEKTRGLAAARARERSNRSALRRLAMLSDAAGADAAGAGAARLAARVDSAGRGAFNGPFPATAAAAAIA